MPSTINIEMTPMQYDTLRTALEVAEKALRAEREQTRLGSERSRIGADVQRVKSLKQDLFEV